MRTGSEPVTARSPLRMRFWLSVWGLIWTALGTTAFAIAGNPGWALACGVLLLIVATDLVLVLRHIRLGARYQPGRDVPPYEPGRHGRGPEQSFDHDLGSRVREWIREPDPAQRDGRSVDHNGGRNGDRSDDRSHGPTGGRRRSGHGQTHGR